MCKTERFGSWISFQFFLVSLCISISCVPFSGLTYALHYLFRIIIYLFSSLLVNLRGIRIIIFVSWVLSVVSRRTSLFWFCFKLSLGISTVLRI